MPFPHRFLSSDLYKVMEGAAYLLMIKPDPALEKRLDAMIDVIADAQQDDGYLYVAHICKIAHPGEMGERGAGEMVCRAACRDENEFAQREKSLVCSIATSGD